MVINKKILIIDVLILVLSIFVYGYNFETGILVCLSILNGIRILWKKFSPHEIWIDWTLFSINAILFMYFYLRGYLSQSSFVKYGYMFLLFLLGINLLLSIVILLKTFKTKKINEKKMKKNISIVEQVESLDKVKKTKAKAKSATPQTEEKNQNSQEKTNLEGIPKPTQKIVKPDTNKVINIDESNFKRMELNRNKKSSQNQEKDDQNFGDIDIFSAIR